MPTSTLLLDLLFLLETWEYSVQVVLLDTHLGGKLGDRDPRLPADELQSLGGTRATALASSRTATGCGGGGCGGSRRRCLSGLCGLGRTSTARTCRTALGAARAARTTAGRCSARSGRSAGRTWSCSANTREG